MRQKKNSRHPLTDKVEKAYKNAGNSGKSGKKSLNNDGKGNRPVSSGSKYSKSKKSDTGTGKTKSGSDRKSGFTKDRPNPRLSDDSGKTSFDRKRPVRKRTDSGNGKSVESGKGSFDRKDKPKRGDRETEQKSFSKRGEKGKDFPSKKSSTKDFSDNSKSYGSKRQSTSSRVLKKDSDKHERPARERKSATNSFSKPDFKKKRPTDKKGSFSDSKSFDKKSFDKKPFDKKSFDKKPFNKKTFDKTFDKKDSDKKGTEDKSPKDKPSGYFDKRTGSFKKPGLKKESSMSEDDLIFSELSEKSFSKKKPAKSKRNQPSTDGTIRLNKYISNSGISSRREADELITQGLISVNGEVITELGYKVKQGDVVKYEGKTLKREKLVYILLNKPKDYITTMDDPQERRTVMDLIAGACEERVYPVGRLDRNTTGLLLLTNDGELADTLTHPSSQIGKVYEVELDRPLEKSDYDTIVAGKVRLFDGLVQVDEIAFLEKGKKNIGIEIHEGRNRIVRRLFEQLGYEVVKLDRTSYAGLTKLDLPRGRWRMLTRNEVSQLKNLRK